MFRTPVSSTSLQSVGYDEEKQVLEIDFHSGNVYQYFSVPHEVYQGLMAASSHGSYFEKNVKKAGYSYQRVG
jgi:hypothetical protein